MAGLGPDALKQALRVAQVGERRTLRCLLLAPAHRALWPGREDPGRDGPAQVRRVWQGGVGVGAGDRLGGGWENEGRTVNRE